MSLFSASALEPLEASSALSAAAAEDAEEELDVSSEGEVEPVEEEDEPVGLAEALEPLEPDVRDDDPLDASASSSLEASLTVGDVPLLPPLELVATSSVWLPPARPPKTRICGRSDGGFSSAQTVTSPGPELCGRVLVSQSTARGGAGGEEEELTTGLQPGSLSSVPVATSSTADVCEQKLSGSS